MPPSGEEQRNTRKKKGVEKVKIPESKLGFYQQDKQLKESHPPTYKGPLMLSCLILPGDLPVFAP